MAIARVANGQDGTATAEPLPPVLCDHCDDIDRLKRGETVLYRANG